MPKGEPTDADYFNRDAVLIPTDITQPFGNAARNSVRGRSSGRSIHTEQGRALGSGRGLKSVSRRSICSSGANFRAPNGNRSAAGFGTITSTYDSRAVDSG